MKKVRWGVLGVAGIAVRRVIPGMKQCELAEVTAIASRDLARAQDAAEKLGIAHAFGSYEEMLRDPEVDVIYNPLPNHLHIPWTIKAAEAGKHVLCEKPLSMNAAEAEQLFAVRERTGVVIGEAFMVKTAPQWVRLREIVQSGEIGELRAISGFFSYTNTDPANIRNIPDFGGGGIMDIGCYPIFTSRFVSGQERPDAFEPGTGLLVDDVVAPTHEFLVLKESWSQVAGPLSRRVEILARIGEQQRRHREPVEQCRQVGREDQGKRFPVGVPARQPLDRVPMHQLEIRPAGGRAEPVLPGDEQM